MLVLKTISMRNFLSVGNVTQAIRLDEHGLTLVLGNNADSNGGVTKNGAGKAQCLSAKIKTPGGWTTMGEINLGDTITAWDGTQTKVVGVFPQGKVPVYRVSFSDGRSTTACEDHLWKTWVYRDGSWNWQIMNTGELIAHKEKSIPSRRAYVPLAYHEAREDVQLPMNPRLLGLLLGDGCITGGKLMISTMDHEIVTFVESALPDGYHLRKSTGCDYVITRGQAGRGKTCVIRAALADMGLLGCKSHNKFIPDAFMTASESQKLELLSGLIDSDGYIGRNGDISFSSASERLALSVQEMVRSLGGTARHTYRSTSYTYKGIKKNGLTTHKISIRYRNPRDLVRLSRKLARLGESYQYAENLKLEITDIVYEGDKEAQCISIDHEDHLYVTDDYIVTHNTAILQAISFALYGQPLTKIKVDNLINNINQRGMMVTLDFEIDDKAYRIERGRKPNILKFFVNGEEIEDMSLGENRETQHDISGLIGMTHQMFTHIVALNTYTTPFLKLRAGEQREVSEELLGVTQISSRAEVLKKLMGTTKDMLRQEEANIKATQEANTRIDRAIEQAEREALQWLNQHNASVATLASQIEELSVIDFDKEKGVFDALDAWNTHQRDLQATLNTLTSNLVRVQAELARLRREESSLASTDPQATFAAANQRLDNERARKLNEVAKITESVSQIEEEITLLQMKIDDPGDHSCVTCDQPLEGTDHLAVVIANLETQMTKKLANLTNMQASITAVTNDVSSLDGEVENNNQESKRLLVEKTARLADITLELAPLIGEETKIKRAISSAKDGMATEEDKPQTIFDTRDDLYATKHLLDTCVQELARERVKDNPYDGHLASLKGTLQAVDFDEINRLTELQRHQDFLMKLLTNKDSFVRKKIIDQNLYYLNTRLNFYLDKLGLPHEVVFQNDLTTEITLLGRDFDFEQLSRGEMNRVIMSVSWAFRDVWESLNHSINLIWVDELIDNGLDSQGAEAALSIMKSFSRNRKNVFLISHRDELVGRIDRTLLVSKDNGFTTITEDLS